MPRLIDADKLKADFIGNRYGTQAIEYVIDHQPTVDAVRHGHWIKANDPMSSPFDTMKRCLCSECREWAKVTSYCPNCGARMDEEDV